MSKEVLVAYYSHSGNTHKIAMLICQKTGGILLEILPKAPYPTNYDAVVEQAKKEIKADFLPAIKNKNLDLSPYDTIFVGTPNWCSTIAPPLATFLTENNLSGKRIIPFCTHGGGGLAKIAKDIRRLCSKSTLRSSFDIRGDDATGAEDKIAAWLNQISEKK